LKCVNLDSNGFNYVTDDNNKGFSILAITPPMQTKTKTMHFYRYDVRNYKTHSNIIHNKMLSVINTATV